MASGWDHKTIPIEREGFFKTGFFESPFFFWISIFLFLFLIWGWKETLKHGIEFGEQGLFVLFFFMEVSLSSREKKQKRRINMNFRSWTGLC